MGNALGFVDISGVVPAVDALDIMCKTSNVKFLTWERKMGGRLVTLIIEGSVSAVTEAVESAVNNAIKKPVCHAVIANPHEEILKLIEKSCNTHFGKKTVSKNKLTQSDIQEK